MPSPDQPGEVWSAGRVGLVKSVPRRYHAVTDEHGAKPITGL